MSKDRRPALPASGATRRELMRWAASFGAAAAL